MKVETGPLLQQINWPEDLRKLDRKRLNQVSDELRQYIIDMVSQYGGHFGAGLGVVELTVALHYVFNTPEDLLVWDVGHQAYGHKILTGRRKNFHTNRRLHGLSGFPNRKESAYDPFGGGHSSTSISAALGMALADAQMGDAGRQHIAVIGDGALSAGMAFEALDHAGVSDTNLLIILNDNHISIDSDVGALREHLNEIISSSEKKRAGNRNLFQTLNLGYFGPVDGNDVQKLVDTLQEMKQTRGPKLLHVSTVKGKGFPQAEREQTKWHAPGIFDKITGEIRKSTGAGPLAPKYQEVFGRTILELAQKNEKIMAITPAMPSGSSLIDMMKAMPGRALDVGICEQHAVTLAAGMATRGMKPFCVIYSTFMQRAYDQVIHDVAVQDLPVAFCLDRAGLVGEDGATHQGAYDIAYMRCIPNLIVSAPMDEVELRNLLFTAQLSTTVHPMVIRYPRGRGVQTEGLPPFEEVPIGKGRKIQEGKEIAILSYGHPGNFVTKAVPELKKMGLQPAHYDMRFVKPLDDALLQEIFAQFDQLITIEDGTVCGGFGSAILEWANVHRFHADIKILGIPDKIIEHGKSEEQYREAGIDETAIVAAVRELTGK